MPEHQGTFLKEVLDEMGQEYGSAQPAETPQAQNPATAQSETAAPPVPENPKTIQERCEELANKDPEFASALFDFGLSRMKLPERVQIDVKSTLDGVEIPEDIKEEIESSPAIKWLFEKVIKERIDPAVQWTIREGKESEASRLMDRLDSENEALDSMLAKHNLTISDNEYKAINALAAKADVSLVESYRARYGDKIEKSKQSGQKRIEIRKSTPGGSRDSAVGRAGDASGRTASELTVADVPEAVMALGMEKGMTAEEVLWGYRKKRGG